MWASAEPPASASWTQTPTSSHHLHSCPATAPVGRQSSAPVHNALLMQVLQSTADLGSVEDGPCLWEASLAHVVDVELEVTSVHQCQHQAQRILGLIGIGQAHLWPNGPKPSGRRHRPPGGRAGASRPKYPQCYSSGPSLLPRPGINTQNLPFPGISKNGRQCLEGMRGGERGKDQPGE